MTRAISIACVLLLAACGGASPPTAGSSAEEHPEPAPSASQPASSPQPASSQPASAPQRLTEIFERLASDITTLRGDCIQLAGVVTSWVESHRAQYPTLARSASSTQLDDADKQRYSERLHSALDTIVSASSGCQGSGRVRDAFTDLDQLLNSP